MLRLFSCAKQNRQFLTFQACYGRKSDVLMIKANVGYWDIADASLSMTFSGTAMSEYS